MFCYRCIFRTISYTHVLSFGFGGVHCFQYSVVELLAVAVFALGCCVVELFDVVFWFA
jgi:hypothetical protein